jgi:transposase-like protein
MAAISESAGETHVEDGGSMEAFESQVAVVDDLPQMESSAPIECVLSSLAASSTAPLMETDVPVPTGTENINSPPPSTTEVSVVSGPTVKKPSSRLSTRRSFTTKFKLECIEHAERTKNKTGTARKFNVDRRRIQEWCTQKEKLLSIPKQQKRLSNGGKREGLEDEQQYPPLGSELTDANTPTVVGGGLTDTETPLVRGIDALTQDAIVETVVRGLSGGMGGSGEVLPATMIKLIQDISADLVSQDNKVAMETMLRETSLEILAQRGMSSSQQLEIEGASKDCNSATFAPELQERVETSGQLSSEQPDTVPVNVDIEGMEMDQSQQAREGVDDGGLARLAGNISIPEPAFSAMDITTQTAILDALMQVATSMQATANDMLQSLASPTTVTAKSLEPTYSEGPRDVITAPKELEITPGPVEIGEPISVEVAMSEGIKENQALDVPSSPARPVFKEALHGEDNTSGNPTAQSVANLHTRIKKYYTVDFKLECVKYAEAKSKCAAARHFNVDRRRVQDWCAQKSKFLQVRSVSLVEKTPNDDEAEIEKQLAAVVKEKLDSGMTLTRRMVKDEAVRLFRECGNTTYVPNIGWVAKFMIRNGINLVSSQPLQSTSTTASEVAVEPDVGTG